MPRVAHQRFPGARLFAGVFAVAASLACLGDNPRAADPAFFRTSVEPILQAHCFDCHSHASGRMKGGLALDSRSGWVAGGERGPAIIPGSTDASPLIQAIRRGDPKFSMPPKSPLTAEDVRVLEEWVRQGAADPRTQPVPPPDAPAWWAIQPLAKPPVPGSSSDHPIDAFVKKTLESSSAVLAPEAPRRVLLRRLAVDLHGLHPSPEDIEAFERDPNPAALEEVVDRHLASPHYGERWARHWLDVAHFAETHGHDQDRPRENAWPYRDYLIRALNSDKPYARFVQEQVAADALFPNEPETLPALGFLAAGPWDESSLRDIRDDTLDREIGRYLDRDDMIANVMSAFAGVTVHCARCHDHKFDPISQKDYYALQAVFAGTEKAERLYDLDPAINAARLRWMRLQVGIDRRDTNLVTALLDDTLIREQRAWESSVRDAVTPWSPLAPVSWTNRHGSDFKRLDDLSLLATGPSPTTEVTTVTFRLGAAHPTALRLEVLPDESLPKKGPGRAENGNLHLTDVQAWFASPGQPETFLPLALHHPTSDFEQDGWTIAHAFDADPKTGWGIHPEESKAHFAVVEIREPGSLPEGALLRIALKQEHGRHHTLGRFRISATTQAPPVRATPVPPQLLPLLAKAPEERSPTETWELLYHYLGGRAARELLALPEPKRVYAGTGIYPPNGGQKPVAYPRPVHVLRRGEITKPLEAANPGTLQCISGLNSRFESHPDGAARRADLARWLAHHDNPLVWRSIVNRVWHHHFGRGIVDTPNDFGRMGGTPASRELLDWLAVTFRDDLGGSLKRLHRLILTSQTWRQQAADPLTAHAFQPLRRRLDAETFRDALLSLSGRLDLTMGGPSVKQFLMSDGIHVTPNVDYAGYDVASPGNHRRSIYRFLFRTLPDPLMDAMDAPSGDQSAPVRSESFTALQAFALMNHPFVARQSAGIAERARSLASSTETQTDLVLRWLFLRPPGSEELRIAAHHASQHGLPDLCRLLLNSNEFHFVD